MNWLINNWYMIFIVAIIFFISGYAASNWMKQPTSQKIENVKSWLIYACVEAEKTFKGGTGSVKLRYVYDLFISKFPAVANIISFETFSGWVDDALEYAKHLMETNINISDYVNN